MKLVVYGATGFTGTLISTLAFEDPEIDLTLAGRNESKLIALKNTIAPDGYGPRVAVASIDDAFKLQQAIEGHDAVINCAGPFTDTGPVVAHVASEVGAHYLDTTGEQSYIARVRDEVNPTVGLLPAAAFEYAIGDCVAAIAAQNGARTINLMYRVEAGNMSVGTKKSIIRTIQTPGISYENNKERVVKTGYMTFKATVDDETRTGVWFAGGEILTVPTYADVITVRTFMIMPTLPAKLIKTFRSTLPPLINLTSPLIDKFLERQTNTKSSENRFTISAFDQNHQHLASARGTGSYQLTAKVSLLAAHLLVEKSPKGFTSVAALTDPTGFLESLGIEIDAP